MRNGNVRLRRIGIGNVRHGDSLPSLSARRRDDRAHRPGTGSPWSAGVPSSGNGIKLWKLRQRMPGNSGSSGFGSSGFDVPAITSSIQSASQGKPSQRPAVPFRSSRQGAASLKDLLRWEHYGQRRIGFGPALEAAMIDFRIPTSSNVISRPDALRCRSRRHHDRGPELRYSYAASSLVPKIRHSP